MIMLNSPILESLCRVGAKAYRLVLQNLIFWVLYLYSKSS